MTPGDEEKELPAGHRLVTVYFYGQVLSSKLLILGGAAGDRTPDLLIANQ